ncbi:hypothetical protein [Edaphobacter albus]|uniref:hypothetical protein n=1 Tax=Edaphobacter sp. 4G125 TaxID=2763071 RepID=UPI001647FB07|nr:hypothetical protein [Edaphobacter sp. 4G125]QNI37444.1 hypothetical protein H7846_03800 [Edaphobacter sp. 4G125]
MKVKVLLCRHLKTNGTQCQSPQMEGSNYCFFHDRLHARHKNYRFTKTTERSMMPVFDIKLHALEDAESVQVAISAVVNALAVGVLDEKKAKALLYGLQLASINITRLAPKPKQEEIVREVSTTDDGLHLAWTNAYTVLPRQPIPFNSSVEYQDELPRLPNSAETKSLPEPSGINE